MSKPSKNIPMPISHSIRRWNEEIGRRSSRAPAFTLVGRSFPPGENVHASHRQSFDCEAAILFEGVLLSHHEKFLAAPSRGRIEFENALDQGIGLSGQTILLTNQGNQTDLLRLLRIDRVAEEDKGEGKSWQRVFSEIGHDGRGRKTGTHLRKREPGMLGHKNKVAKYREPEAETWSVALYLGDADQ